MATSLISVRGLKEFQADISKAAAFEPNEVRKEMRTIAQIVVDEAIPEMKSQFVSDPSRLDGALEDSLRASASASKRGISASVLEGRPGNGNGDHKAPYAGWWEFGGPRAKTNRPPNRAFVKEGRVLFKVAKRKEAELVEAITVVIARLFPGNG